MSDENSPSRINKTTSWISKNVFNHQVGVFLIFLAISTMLWFVTSLSEEVSRQITCRLQISNIPDSVTLISTPPKTVSANVRARGTDLLRNFFGAERVVNVNFNNFSRDGRLALSKNDLFELVQASLGDESQLQGVYPDSIGLYYTWLPPLRVPVKVEVTATSTPNAHISGAITALTDSVEVFMLPSAVHKIKSVSTADIHLNNLDKTTVVRVPLAPITGARAVPDSIDVRINVEPYVTVTRRHAVEAINVPKGYKVMFSPEIITASYRVPKSESGKLPEVHVVADFETVSDTVSNSKIALTTDPWISYIFLDRDSIDFTISAADGN